MNVFPKRFPFVLDDLWSGSRLKPYALALFTAALSVAVRAVFDPLLGGDHAFVIPLLGVVFVSWAAGFAPAALTLATSMLAVTYLFVAPRHSLVVANHADRVAVGLFVLTGVICALLGSAQRRARKATQESERTLNDLFENGPVGLDLIGPDGVILRANRAELDLLGYRVEEYVGRPVADVFADPAVARHLLRRVKAGDTLRGVEARLIGKDGTARDVLISADGLWRDGAFVHARCFTRDITDRLRAERELRDSEARLRHLADAMPQVVWAAGPDGTVDYYNAKWYEYTGQPRDEHGDASWTPVIHPDDLAETRASWAEAVRTGTPYEAEYRLRGRAGAYRWFLARALPALDGAGLVARWFGSCTDVHDQKEQSETLERLVGERTAELRRSNEELERFAYIASHDLQEPLRKVQSFGDLLEKKYRAVLGEDGQGYIARMVSSAGRMRQLIQDLLRFARVNTKGEPFVPVDLNEVAAGVLSDLAIRTEQTGATVDVGPLGTVDADPTQMRQLFQNVIGNALKFQKPGVPPVITVRGEVLTPLAAADGAGDGVYQLTVVDNGIGFDEKYLDRIFEVFQRLHGRGEYEGTGVGLALCRKIAERHRGAITARSRPGEGATFVITLPARRPAA